MPNTKTKENNCDENYNINQMTHYEILSLCDEFGTVSQQEVIEEVFFIGFNGFLNRYLLNNLNTSPQEKKHVKSKINEAITVLCNARAKTLYDKQIKERQQNQKRVLNKRTSSSKMKDILSKLDELILEATLFVQGIRPRADLVKAQKQIRLQSREFEEQRKKALLTIKKEELCFSFINKFNQFKESDEELKKKIILFLSKKRVTWEDQTWEDKQEQIMVKWRNLQN